MSCMMWRFCVGGWCGHVFGGVCVGGCWRGGRVEVGALGCERRI